MRHILKMSWLWKVLTNGKLGTLPAISPCQQVKKTPPNIAEVFYWWFLPGHTPNLFIDSVFRFSWIKAKTMLVLCQKSFNIAQFWHIKVCISDNYKCSPWMFLFLHFPTDFPCNFDWHGSVPCAWQSSLFSTCIRSFNSHSICVCRCISWALERCDNFPNVVITDRFRIAP